MRSSLFFIHFLGSCCCFCESTCLLFRFIVCSLCNCTFGDAWGIGWNTKSTLGRYRWAAVSEGAVEGSGGVATETSGTLSKNGDTTTQRCIALWTTRLQQNNDGKRARANQRLKAFCIFWYFCSFSPSFLFSTISLYILIFLYFLSFFFFLN